MTAPAGVSAPVPTFVEVQKEGTDFSLANLSFSGLEIADSLQILGGEDVIEQLFWFTEDVGMGPTGWYDEGYNLVVSTVKTFPTGNGLFLSMASGGTVTYQGEVLEDPVILSLNAGITMIGSPRPYPVCFSDLVFTGLEMADSIQIMTGETVTEQLFWFTEDVGMGPTGWYDENYALIDANKALPEGFGFWISTANGGTVTIPAL